MELSVLILYFDLEIFKHVAVNPERPITEPEDCRGASRSERSFDGVKFKRIIVVLGGMKTGTVAKRDPR